MDLLLARQAVFDEQENIYAYNLIFEDYKNDEDYMKIENKRIKFICNIGTNGLRNFTENKKAFCNFTYMSLFEGIPELLGSDNIIVQLSSKIDYSEEVIENIIELRRTGFQTAYVITEYEDFDNSISELIDLYKISFNKMSEDEIKEVLEAINKSKFKGKLLGEKIDDSSKYNLVKKFNFDYFSGDIFERPEIISDEDISVKNSNRFNIIVELLKDELNIERLEFIIKTDLSISYKLVRFLNSPTFGFVQNIASIRQAIMLLGQDELRKWLTLVVVSEMSITNNEEMMNNTIIRGRFCELVAEKVCPSRKAEAFMVGLFSELDSLIGKTMNMVVQTLHLDIEVKEALVGKKNILRNILELVKAYEKMDVRLVQEYSKKLGINEMALFQLYSQAIDWLSETKLNFNK